MMCSCGRRISSNSPCCPYCGNTNPMYHGSKPFIETPPTFHAIIDDTPSNDNVSCGGILLGILIVLLGLIIGLFAFLTYADMSLTELLNHFGLCVNGFEHFICTLC